MEISKVHVNLNHFIAHDFDSADRMIHYKKMFQFSIVRFPADYYQVSTDGNPPIKLFSEIFVASPMQTQCIWLNNEDKHLHARRLFMNIDIHNGCSIDFYYEFPIVPPEDVQKQIALLLEQLDAIDDPFDQNICCYQIAKALFSCAKERTQLFHPKLIQVLQFIRGHYREKLSVGTIAAQNQISASQVFSLFRKYCRCTPVTYLMRYRLDAAAQLLLSTDLTVAEIAAEVGFEDYSYFSKCFKHSFQLSPSRYRSSRNELH